VEELDLDVSITDLFQYSTIDALVSRFGGTAEPEESLQAGAEARLSRRRDEGDNAIAVIGMAGRFPGAPDVETLWENLLAGVESIRFHSEDDLRQSNVPETLLQHPNYVKAGTVLDHADSFDAGLFGYTPREAELIDPQQRIFLECAWEAMERAGYDPERYDGMIGVYAGTGVNMYLANLRSRPDILATSGGLQAHISSDKDYLATRVSYKLNLRGPSMTVQAACSTSLIAVHEACTSAIPRWPVAYPSTYL
jgi:acyl transferase domain-containing protein